MRKLKLDIDSIEVESFVTAGSGRVEGTVQGHLATEPQGCYDLSAGGIMCTTDCYSWGGAPTCANTCAPEYCNTWEEVETCAWTSCGTGVEGCYCQ